MPSGRAASTHLPLGSAAFLGTPTVTAASRNSSLQVQESYGTPYETVQVASVDTSSETTGAMDKPPGRAASIIVINSFP
jgi:hypothetical protein